MFTKRGICTEPRFRTVHASVPQVAASPPIGFCKAGPSSSTVSLSSIDYPCQFENRLWHIEGQCVNSAGPCSRDLLSSFCIGIKGTLLILKGNAFHNWRLAFCLLKLGV